MKYASFRRPDGGASFGRIEGGRIIDLGRMGGDRAQSNAVDLRGALALGTLAELPAGPSYSPEEVVLLPVIPQPAVLG